MSKEKGGSITHEDSNELLNKARKTLEKVKNSRSEKAKVAYRVDRKTIILVSKKKLKTLLKNKQDD